MQQLVNHNVKKKKETLPENSSRKIDVDQQIGKVLEILKRSEEYYQLLINNAWFQKFKSDLESDEEDRPKGEFFQKACQLYEKNEKAYDICQKLIKRYFSNKIDEAPIRKFLEQNNAFVSYFISYGKDLLSYQKKIIEEFYRHYFSLKLKFYFDEKYNLDEKSIKFLISSIRTQTWEGYPPNLEALRRPRYAFIIFSIIEDNRTYKVVIPKAIRDALAGERKKYKNLMAALDNKCKALKASSTKRNIGAYKKFIQAIRIYNTSPCQFNKEELGFIEKNMPKEIAPEEKKLLEKFIGYLKSNPAPSDILEPIKESIKQLSNDYISPEKKAYLLKLFPEGKIHTELSPQEKNKLIAQLYFNYKNIADPNTALSLVLETALVELLALDAEKLRKSQETRNGIMHRWLGSGLKQDDPVFELIREAVLHNKKESMLQGMVSALEMNSYAMIMFGFQETKAQRFEVFTRQSNTILDNEVALGRNSGCKTPVDIMLSFKKNIAKYLIQHPLTPFHIAKEVLSFYWANRVTKSLGDYGEAKNKTEKERIVSIFMLELFFYIKDFNKTEEKDDFNALLIETLSELVEVKDKRKIKEALRKKLPIGLKELLDNTVLNETAAKASGIKDFSCIHQMIQQKYSAQNSVSSADTDTVDVYTSHRSGMSY